MKLKFELGKAIFLDMNGVILDLPPAIKDGSVALEADVPEAYTMHPKDVVLLPEAIEGLYKLQSTDYKLIIVSNQSCIGRGFCTLTEMEVTFGFMVYLLEQQKIKIQDYQFCPHHPDINCGCRKPAPGMLWKKIMGYQLDRSLCWMIGDSLTDIQAGERTDITNLIYVGDRPIHDYTGKPLIISANLSTAADIILKHDAEGRAGVKS